MTRSRHPFIRPETADILAAEEARNFIEGVNTGQIAELLEKWSKGEITTLQKILEILRNTHAEMRGRYICVDIVPRPEMVKATIAYHDNAVAAMSHAIGVLERCKSKGKRKQ